MLAVHQRAIAIEHDELHDALPSAFIAFEAAICLLRERGGLAILLVEQYFDFARDLADRITVMDRGAIVAESLRRELDEADVRRRLSV